MYIGFCHFFNKTTLTNGATTIHKGYYHFKINSIWFDYAFI